MKPGKIGFLLLIVLSVNLYAGEIRSDERLKLFKESVSEESIGNYKEAIAIIKKALESDDYLVNLRLGWLYYLDKKYDQSKKFYNEASRISNKSIESLLGLTYPYSAANEWDKVEKLYREILTKDPHNYTANMNLGKIFFNSGSYINAKNYFQNIYEDYPSDTDANLYLGWTFYYLGNKSEARNYFINTLITDSDNSSAIEGLSLTR